VRVAVTGRTPGLVDRCEVLFSGEPSGSPQRVPALGETCIVSGRLVEVPDSQRVEIATESGFRQTVATGFGRAAAAGSRPGAAPLECGFRTFLRTDALGVGEHLLFVECVTMDGVRFRGEGPPFRLTILDSRREDRGRAHGFIDEVRVGARTVGPDHSPIDAPPGSVVVLRGWIIEERTQTSGAVAFMLVNGRPLPAAYGFERPDVADVYGAAALRSGFVGRIDVDSLADDRVDVRIAVLTDQT
jgi:hypothetical protein